MPPASELTESELENLEDFLSRVDGGKIPNVEALDGFFAALACCPDLVPPSEYMPVIQSGETEDGDLVFEKLEDAERFMTLVNKHWNHINGQLNEGMVYVPLIMEDEGGNIQGNDWANGFICGTEMRREIWSDIVNDEERGGSIIPILALAYEDHPDPKMRPFKEPIDDKKREDLIVMAAAGVMRMYEYFRDQRGHYLPSSTTFTRPHPKVGRNEPCPCGSGKKYKKCCGGPTIH